MSESIRKSRNGGGDLRYESEDTRLPTGEWWYSIWENGDKEAGIAIRSEGELPLNLEDWQ